jgi:hypothetical protein
MDPIAVWGALTGTAGLGITARREIVNRRQSIRVEHRWQYKYEKDDPETLSGMVVYVMVTNTGARDIVVTHVGWEWLGTFEIDDHPALAKDPALEDVPEGIHKIAPCRAEIPLEPVLLHPDGLPAKFIVEVGQLLHLIDPFETIIQAVAYTDAGGTQWHSGPAILAPDVPLALQGKRIIEGLKRLKEESDPPHKTPTPFLWALDPVDAEKGDAGVSTD